MSSRLHGRFRLPTANTSSPALQLGSPLQKVMVSLERRWVALRQAERGEVLNGGAHSSQRGDA